MLSASLEVGLPILSAVGAGLVAYALTGGPEECVEEVKEEEVREMEGSAEGPHLLPMNPYDELACLVDEKVSEMILQAQKFHTIPPPWAEKMEETLEDMRTEMSAMRDQQTRLLALVEELKASPSLLLTAREALAEQQVREQVAKETLEKDLRLKLTLALCKLATQSLDIHPETLNFLSDDAQKLAEDRYVAFPKKKWESAIEMLSMFVRNLQRKTPTAKRILTTTASFKNVSLLVGTDALLSAIGFELEQREWHWKWSLEEASEDDSTPSLSTPHPELVTELLEFCMKSLQEILHDRDVFLSKTSPSLCTLPRRDVTSMDTPPPQSVSPIVTAEEVTKPISFDDIFTRAKQTVQQVSTSTTKDITTDDAVNH